MIRPGKGESMFCNRCGKELDQDARFCSSCGAAVGGTRSERKPPVSSEPQLVLRPRFVGWVAALSVLPFQLFFTVWGAGFFGGFSLMAVEAFGLPIPFGSTFLFFGLLFFFGMPLATYAVKKRTYARTEYRFYEDRLEYVEGFWSIENKSVRYDRVSEISMRRGILQKRNGLGTIVLATPASVSASSRSGSGIRISDVEDPEKVYRVVENLVGKR